MCVCVFHLLPYIITENDLFTLKILPICLVSNVIHTYNHFIILPLQLDVTLVIAITNHRWNTKRVCSENDVKNRVDKNCTKFD